MKSVWAITAGGGEQIAIARKIESSNQYMSVFTNAFIKTIDVFQKDPNNPNFSIFEKLGQSIVTLTEIYSDLQSKMVFSSNQDFHVPDCGPLTESKNKNISSFGVPMFAKSFQNYKIKVTKKQIEESLKNTQNLKNIPSSPSVISSPNSPSRNFFFI